MLWLISACSSTNPTPPPDSGIQGQVLIGPTCPVVREGMDCADKPFQANFTVLTPTGDEVTHFQSDQQGLFNIPLAPGDYVLHPVSTNSLPFATDQDFTVTQGQFTQLTILFDSGIR
jgi:hypothetical protein